MHSNRVQHATRLTIVALMACAATAIDFASSAGTASSQSDSHPYIEQPQQTVTTYAGSSYGWNPAYSPGPFGYYDYGYGTVPYRAYPPHRYFFPPTPPPLGDPYVANQTKSASKMRSQIPLALSAYVEEPFYSPLSTFLYDEDLSRRRQDTLNAYRATRSALVAELRAKLAAVKSLNDEAREAQLSDFARDQTPRIAALEKSACDIRDDLTRWHLFSDTSNWNEARSWRLGDDARWESTLDEAKLMRGAAYFQDGLSPAQRRLLCEYAMELDDSGRGPMADLSLISRGPFFYFNPATSRIRLPLDMPADLDARIADYRRLKTRLEKELHDVLYKEDRRWFDWDRASALRDLAGRQTADFATLQTLAEEIRRGLAKLPNPAAPVEATDRLPPALAKSLRSYLTRWNEFKHTMQRRAQDLRARFPTSRVEFVRMDGGFGIQLIGNRRLGAAQKAQVQAAGQELVPFNDAQVKAYLALVHEKLEIRSEVTKAAGPLSPMVTPRVADLILADYLVVIERQQLWRRYDDYRIAVLQPGLSPEQRRLLFGEAVRSLNLQLPFYTY